ncbi:MAG: glycoside hydrolase family 28 protein [Acholeplasmatales bacterium]|nr:glycoside hydrolase family 28 protein [Acholeplasmatales bacterium]
MNFTVELPKIKSYDYILEDYGKITNDPKQNGALIQNLIDKCSNEGGGRVVLPAKYISSAPLVIKNNVNLYLPQNCYLFFPKRKEFYHVKMANWEGMDCMRTNSPISAYKASNIAITGKGTIDGDGFSWRPLKDFKVTKKFFDKCLKMSKYCIEGKEGLIWYPSKSSYEGCLLTEAKMTLEMAQDYYDFFRPVLISLVECDHILLEGIISSNSPAWNIHPLFCNHLTMDGVIVKNEYSAQNGDGVDVESCTNVEIKNSTFEVGDDGICIKSGKNKKARMIKRPTKNVYIHDCMVYHAHGGIVIGSEMSRGIENLWCTNSTFVGTDIGIRFKSALGRGGIVSDIHIENINMVDILNEAMIFNMDYSLFKMAHEASDDVISTDPEDIPYFRDIYINNVYCSGSKTALKVIGINEKTIDRIFISNSYINASNSYTLKKCGQIHCDNVTFNINGKKEFVENNDLSLDI